MSNNVKKIQSSILWLIIAVKYITFNIIYVNMLEIVIIYQDTNGNWIRDDINGEQPLSIGINGVITQGRVVARMALLGYHFWFENTRSQLWFRKK